MHHKSKSRETMTGVDTDEIIEKNFNLLLHWHQVSQEQL